MDVWGGLFVRFLCGANFGVFLMAAMSAASDADKREGYDDIPELADKYMGELPKVEDEDDSDSIQGN